MESGDILLTGQVAIITGGGGGIGRGIAIAFAEMGADVVIGDVIPERCAEVKAKVEALGRTCLSVPMNVMEADQVRDLVKRASDTFGRIDILVNNAGGTAKRPFLDSAEKNWRRVIDLNLISLFTATAEAAPVMIAGGRGGSIINTTSIEGSRAAPNFAVYAACKAGVDNFTRTMALELADHDIRVNAIAPDYTDTPGTRGQFQGAADPAERPPLPADHLAMMSRRIPLRRPGLEEECGRAAVYLASRMGSYVTGTILRVDGGTFGSSGWVRDRAGEWVLSE